MPDEQPIYMGRLAGFRMPQREDFQRYALAFVYSVGAALSMDHYAAAFVRDKADDLLFRRRYRNEFE